MSKELKIAIKAAEEGGKILREFFQSEEIKKINWRKTKTTRADLFSEEKIISTIRKEFPQDEILSEERGRLNGFSDRIWVIDPLDGSTNFMRSNPNFAVSIALVSRDTLEPQIGVIYLPITKEIFYGEKRKGAFWNDKKMRVTSTTELSDTYLVACKGHSEFKRLSKVLYKLSNKIRGVAIIGAAAIECVYVASGRADGYLSFNIGVWDVAAGILLIKEAGGMATDFQGKRWPMKENDFLGSNGKIHEAVLRELK